MKDILLAFPYKVFDQNGFEKILAAFEEKGYDVHLFSDIDSFNFRIDLLPLLINSLKEQDMEGNSGLNRIAVVSNARDALFSWFRCYNSLVDDFIYFIDSNEARLLSEIGNPFFEQLYNFSGVNKESVQGKIYLNLNSNNYRSLFSFLISNKNFRYFDVLDNFDFDNKSNKDRIKKIYHLENVVVPFELGPYIKDPSVSDVLLDASFKPKIELDEEFIELIEKNLYFLVFLVAEIYKMGLDYYEGNKFLFTLFKHLKNLSRENKEMVCRDFITYLGQENIKFPQKIYFLSLIIILKLNDPIILKKFMDSLKKDGEHLDFHYPVLVNTVFYVGKENIDSYDGFYSDRRNEIKRLAEYYKDGLVLNSKYQANSRNIGILVDQLLGKLHSPTKVILDYALSLKKIYPDYNIKVFIEDNFVINRSEVLTPFHFPSVSSREAENEHLDYLKGIDIEIYYSDSGKTKKERTHDILQQIQRFNPEVILTNSDLSLAREFLYDIYPIVYISHGGINYSTVADLYLHPDKQEVLSQDTGHMLNPESILELKAGLMFSDPYKKITRLDLGLSEDDFILITVGNRLANEMDEEFINLISSFLQDRPNAKWLVVGLGRLTLIEQICCQQSSAGKIIKLEYEDDLPALYDICDAYVNPPRKGGAHSIALAMNQGLPVVIFRQPSDGIAYVGEENSAGGTPEKYLSELRLLYENIEYRKKRGELMKKKIQQFDFNSFLNQLLEYFELAKKKFLVRTGI